MKNLMHAFIQLHVQYLHSGCPFLHAYCKTHRFVQKKNTCTSLYNSRVVSAPAQPDSSTRTETPCCAEAEPHQASIYLRSCNWFQSSDTTSGGSESWDQAETPAKFSCSRRGLMTAPRISGSKGSKRKKNRTSLVLPPALRFVSTYTHKNTRRKRERGK